MNAFRICCTVLAAASIVLASTGCAGYTPRDPRDAPWDPKPGQTLFDQMPNWQYQCGVNVKC
jgi:hypothetical protein